MPERVRVLQVIPPPSGSVGYVDQVVSYLPDWVETSYFSWRKAFGSRYDVLHVHWPEQLLRDRSRALTWLNRAAFVVLLVRSRLLRVAIVRTAHNVQPHEDGGRLERAMLGWLRRQVFAQIRLNAATPTAPPAADYLIPHGDYREPLARYPRATVVDGRILYFGLIREYKGVDSLIEVFRGLDDPDVTLHIVGQPADARWRALVESSEAADGRITATLDYVADDVLVSEVTAAQLVVLPYRQMHNSGTILFALSLGRPVLARRSPSNEELQAEVGDSWLHLYEGSLEADDVRRALASAAPHPDAVPSLVGRDWVTIGRRHAQVYRDAASWRARSWTKRMRFVQGGAVEGAGFVPLSDRGSGLLEAADAAAHQRTQDR